MSLSPEQCLTKLNELKEWRKKQEKCLIDKQQNELQREIYRSNGHDDIEFHRKKLNSLINNSGSGDVGIRTPLKIIKESKLENNFEDDYHNHNNKITKRTFLKRGEGLKSRFGVHPDAFKLDNLPKYKYAPRVNLTLKKKKRFERNSRDNQNCSNESANHNDEKKNLEEEEPPEIKAYESDNTEDENATETDSKNSSDDEEPRKFEVKSWATVLDAQNLEPVNVSSIQSFSNANITDTNDLNLFEFLEQKVDSSSFLSNASSIVRLIGKKYKDDVATSDDKIKLSLTPNPRDLSILKENDDISSDESVDDDDIVKNTSRGHVRFSDKILVNEIENSSDQTLNNESFRNSPLNASITSTPNQNLDSHYCRDDISTTSEFNISADLTTDNIAHVIKQLINSKQKETEERNELLKTKIKYFEDEINKFEMHNKLLTKMRQDFEMEKIETENEFALTRQQLEDEKIKIEIYLKDERDKLTQEKTKLEKQRLNPSKKEREEITRLKEQVEELQQDFKTKEARLTSGQSRLRAQIRNLEKQLKEKELEIESLKKENKKIDSENIRLRRMNNNKMLAEINKNIAKLAPKEESASESKKPSPKNQSDKKLPRVNVPSTSSSSSDSEASSDERPETPSSSRTYVKELTPRIDENITAHNSNKNITPKVNEPSKGITVQSLKREINNPDGSKDIWYPNGNIKKISPDGMNYKMLYYNKDIKETNIHEGTVKYYYAETNTWHTTYLDGLEILEFPNGQIEHRFKDGRVEVTFPNGAVRLSNPNDPEIVEEWRYANGTIAKIKINGERIIILPNGQREVHTHNHKRREFPDGTIKIVYSDGSQETRYSNGRVRLKDATGKLVMDSESHK